MKISHSCSFDGVETEGEYYVDETSKEALQIVEKIMNAIVLPQNFIVKTANCKNALATTEGPNRYILYSTHFLENFKKEAKTQWAAYSVLAHEIGHHLSNHNLAETDIKKRKLYELQADKFAGGVLYRLGATLDEAQAGIKTFSLEGETTTHPNKSARLESVAQGWVQAKENQPRTTTETPLVKPNTEESKTTYKEVSGLLLSGKIIGKWQLNGTFKDTYEFFNDGTAKFSQYFAVTNNTQVTTYKWAVKDGSFTRFKIFPNGSLGSPEVFLIKINEDGSKLQIFNRWGEGKIWDRL